MDAERSLAEELEQNVLDMEALIKTILELSVGMDRTPVASNGQLSASNADHVQLLKLLLKQQQAFHTNLDRADGFSQRQHLIGRLEEENEKLDKAIDSIQTTLKDSENILLNSIFQANQKLKSIYQANHRKTSVEELIKYAHRISKTNAVAAPLNWQQGAPERPYPTDVEMRGGLLAKRPAMLTFAGAAVPPLTSVVGGGRSGSGTQQMSPRGTPATAIAQQRQGMSPRAAGSMDFFMSQSPSAHQQLPTSYNQHSPHMGSPPVGAVGRPSYPPPNAAQMAAMQQHQYQQQQMQQQQQQMHQVGSPAPMVAPPPSYWNRYSAAPQGMMRCPASIGRQMTPPLAAAVGLQMVGSPRMNPQPMHSVFPNPQQQQMFQQRAQQQLVQSPAAAGIRRPVSSPRVPIMGSGGTPPQSQLISSQGASVSASTVKTEVELMSSGDSSNSSSSSDSPTPAADH